MLIINNLLFYLNRLFYLKQLNCDSGVPIGVLKSSSKDNTTHLDQNQEYILFNQRIESKTIGKKIDK